MNVTVDTRHPLVTCVLVDEVLTGVVTVFAAILFFLPIRVFHKTVPRFLFVVFCLYAINHLVLKYAPDEDHDTPEWATVLLVIGAVSIGAFIQFVVYLAESILVGLVVLMATHTIVTGLSLTLSVLAAVGVYFFIKLIMATRGTQKGRNALQTVAVSVLTAFIVAMGVINLIRFRTSAPAAEGDPCESKTNMLLLCDYRCASLTSSGDMSWMNAWFIATVLASLLRCLYIAYYGVDTLRELRDRRMYNRLKDQSNTHGPSVRLSVATGNGGGGSDQLDSAERVARLGGATAGGASGKGNKKAPSLPVSKPPSSRPSSELHDSPKGNKRNQVVRAEEDVDSDEVIDEDELADRFAHKIAMGEYLNATDNDDPNMPEAEEAL